MAFVDNILLPIIVALVVAIVVGTLAVFLAPLRRRLELLVLRRTADHGVKILTYGTADEMEGLRPEEMLGMDREWVRDSDFYFAGGVPGDGPGAKSEWSSWAIGHGGEVAGWRHVLIRIQATQDRAVLAMKPRVKVVRQPVVGGVVLGPAKEPGGNGLNVRQFEVDLDASPPQVKYHAEVAAESPQFVLKKGDAEAFLIIVHAMAGRYEWTLDLPVVVDGESFCLRADDDGRPFVTVGREGIEARWWDFDLREWRIPSW